MTEILLSIIHSRPPLPACLALTYATAAAAQHLQPSMRHLCTVSAKEIFERQSYYDNIYNTEVMIRIISIVNMILNTMKKIGLIIKARVIVSNILRSFTEQS